MVRLQVNIDHVATLRNARGGRYPDPVRAAALCEEAGADGITIHLREDRRHIRDADVVKLKKSVTTLLNLEMAVTDEMLAVAKEIRPDLVTLVPEKREERTTEGGLDVVGAQDKIASFLSELNGIPVSTFIDPSENQIKASLDLGCHAVELHTGDYANAGEDERDKELERLARATRFAGQTSLVVAAGHGLTLVNTPPLIAACPDIAELNIGHALVADAVFMGLGPAVKAYLALM